jgi:hypothetical protein
MKCQNTDASNIIHPCQACQNLDNPRQQDWKLAKDVGLKKRRSHEYASVTQRFWRRADAAAKASSNSSSASVLQLAGFSLPVDSHSIYPSSVSLIGWCLLDYNEETFP